MCRSFEVDGRVAFEESLGATHILPWNCDHALRRQQAMRIGVNNLPAYILLTPSETQVLHPPT
jgi:hypothetical protein